MIPSDIRISTGCTSLPFRVSSLIAGLALLALFTACNAALVTKSSDSLGVIRQIVLPLDGRRPESITALRNGDLLISGDDFEGTGKAAWAMRVNSQGKILWEYLSPARGKYLESVELDNGNILECGTIDEQTSPPNPTVDHERAVLDLFTPSGRLVETHILLPPADREWGSEMMRCLRWNDGIAVVAFAHQNPQYHSWLLKLDGSGVMQWQRQPVEFEEMPYGVGEIVATSDHGLAVSTFMQGERNEINVVHIDAKGNVDRQRPLRADEGILLESFSGQIKLVLHQPAAPSSSVTLDNLLATSASVNAAPDIVTDRRFFGGRGFDTSDGSVLLFGRRGSAVRSLAGLTSADGSHTRYFEVMGPYERSDWIGDAARLGPDTFVSVHSQSGFKTLEAKQKGLLDKASTGIVLTWFGPQ